jgi:NAD(P)-dependent dehydrogenase (short-subunit alcohol dehydrogenase family)
MRALRPDAPDHVRKDNQSCARGFAPVTVGAAGWGIFGEPDYLAAKAGILDLTKAMARELTPDGIRSNAICPGFIDTYVTAGKLTNEMRAQVLAGIPMGRAGSAQDEAGCCLFLASDLSAYVTGSEVDVNGGSLIH